MEDSRTRLQAIPDRSLLLLLRQARDVVDPQFGQGQIQIDGAVSDVDAVKGRKEALAAGMSQIFLLDVTPLCCDPAVGDDHHRRRGNTVGEGPGRSESFGRETQFLGFIGDLPRPAREGLLSTAGQSRR